MTTPIWILVFDRDGVQWNFPLRCTSAAEADKTIYHNIYYGRRCLKISVKSWRS